MAQARTIRRIASRDGKHELEIRSRADGLFCYVAHSEVTEDGATYWVPSDFSGLFDSADLAESKARAHGPG
jgi:hypothetical protein